MHIIDNDTPRALPVTTEQAVEILLNSLRGVDLGTGCEAATVVLCELSRASNKGDVNAAGADISRNAFAFFDRFPTTSIIGLTIEPHVPGPVQ